MWVYKSHRDSSGFCWARPALSLSSLRGSRLNPDSSRRCPDSLRLAHFHLGYGRGTTRCWYGWNVDGLQWRSSQDDRIWNGIWFYVGEIRSHDLCVAWYNYLAYTWVVASITFHPIVIAQHYTFLCVWVQFWLVDWGLMDISNRTKNM